MDQYRKPKSIWRGKFSTLKEFYLNAKRKDLYPDEADPDSPAYDPEKANRPLYDMEFYEFDSYQYTIDPDETAEQIENYTAQEKQREIFKCAKSFQYFCHKYVKILHPMYGLIPFVLYKYQCKVIRDYEKNRFNIISKFRQGGLTTVTLLWGLWRCLFRTDQQVMLLSKTDREATDIGMMVDRSIENFPSWLKPPKDSKWNDHLKVFTQTGGALKFYSPEAARGKSVTFLIVDEAAFIPDMETHWKAMWPVLSTGGSCTLVSTVNGLGNWYHETYTNAKDGENKFNIIDLDYWEHPDYSEKYNPDWAKEQLAQLGQKGFLQEVKRSFLGTGETYFNSSIIGELDRNTRNIHPCRKLFAKWANVTKGDDIKKKDPNNPFAPVEKGALWIWKEPIDTHEYTIGVDVAEGVGENGDNCCFQVIDNTTLEQVAEFYSNIIAPHVFSGILNEVGIMYNNALMVIEDMGPGGVVINNLQHHLSYENLYYDSKGMRSGRPGVKVGKSNRTAYLEALQQRLLNGTVRLNSRRIWHEMTTFDYNQTTKRAEAQKGKHDDAIIALCLALYIRDTAIRDIPVGAEVSIEMSAVFKTDIYEEIRKELQRGAPVDWLGDEEKDFLENIDADVLPGVIFNYQRKNNKILKEFGW